MITRRGESVSNIYWGVSGALHDGANPTIMVISDSWFWYPIDNLAIEIGGAMPNQTLVVVGNNGAEAAQWSDKLRKSIDFAYKMYASSVQALMLSGGGNDVAGTSDFLRILQDNCSKATTATECFRPGQPDAIIAKIIGAYKEVILRFRAYNWLKVPMDLAKVPRDMALRRDLFRTLIASLRTAQLALAKDKALGPGRLVAIKSAGTMPEPSDPTAQNDDQWWANELHPTPKGFRLLAAKAFIPALKGVGLT
jgi:hypothetical protein